MQNKNNRIYTIYNKTILGGDNKSKIYRLKGKRGG